MRPALLSAAVLALSAMAAPGMTQERPNADQAAAAVLYQYCVPLFAPGPVHGDRINATASMAQLTPAPDGARPLGFPRADAGYVAASPGDTAVLVFWIGDPGVCQIVLLGPAGVGDGLLGSMTEVGWQPQQQNVASGEDTAASVWTAQPRGYDTPLLVVANRWTSEEEPVGGVRLVINVMRPQP